MKVTHIGSAFAFVLAATPLQIAHAGDACFPSNDGNGGFVSMLGDSTSWGIPTSQASNTWDDWIWRGPSFYCNPRGLTCTYSWTKSNTSGYQWSVGVDMNLGAIPVIGTFLGMFNIRGEYQKQKSYTETFGWTQMMQPGTTAQPVQVVVRRWKGGDFQGGWWRVDGGSCTIRYRVGRAVYTKPGNRYWWDGTVHYGSWNAEVEETRYAMYNIKSYTETFGWTQMMQPGTTAQPVQVVVRRWKGGDFQGGWWRVDGGSCTIRYRVGRAVYTKPGNRYWWDGTVHYGSWNAEVEETRYAMYNIWW
ncbi:hypothetical protein [Xanthomonas sp. MUS 060]|uniref:hypothetical protein n=1 Tax=Xanthomonas sp. MUS 060 TaxID=1588031 RepID=UPI0006965596|nr:hypothetical protein [Xanthomonas sp. MUS 060]